MKKGISISFVFLMLAATLHLAAATHYCSGKVAASNISFSGRPASCGMASQEKDYPLPGTHLNSHCCDDVIIHFGTYSYYTPPFSVVPDIFQYNSQVFGVPGRLPAHSLSVIKSLFSSAGPPGALMFTNVDLSDICVFRI